MNKISINENALISNIAIIKEQFKNDTKFCAVIKANAYGHNLKKIVQIINQYVDYYAVAHLSEAMLVQALDKNKNILVLSKINNSEIQKAIINNIEFSVSNFNDLVKIYEIAKKIKKTAKLHIKLNTGMNRLGVSNAEELERMEEFVMTHTNICIVGVFTHFATPNSNQFYFNLQIDKWNYLISRLKNRYLLHCSSSSAYIYDKNLICDMVRVGISMYGYDQTNRIEKLSPVLSLFSQIEQINCLNKGDFCGYDAEFIADSRKKIAVVGIGYGDGVMRAIAKNGYVLINNCKCKIIGKICMDMLFCDVTECECKVHDIVTLLGGKDSNKITAKDWAVWSGTIEYEVLTNLSLVRE